MPRPVEALPCGSRSTISTRSPTAASAVPRLMAVVVLPTPPFWLATARTRRRRSSGTGKPPESDDAPAGIAGGGDQFGVETPGFAGVIQLGLGALALEEQALGA